MTISKQSLTNLFKKHQKSIIKVLEIKSEKEESKYKGDLQRWLTRKLTKEKRLWQVCKTYEMKIVSNKLTKKQKEILDFIPLESKWLYNYAIWELNQLYKDEEKVDEERMNQKTKEKYIVQVIKDKESFYSKTKLKLQKISEVKKVMIKVGDKFEERELSHIPSSVKDEVITQLQNNIKSLVAIKSKGRKTWSLKFKSFVNTFHLKQYGNSHKIIDDKFIHLTKVGKLRVRGLSQLKNIHFQLDSHGENHFEFANAKITKRPSWYHFMLTTYQDKLNNNRTIDNKYIFDKSKNTYKLDKDWNRILKPNVWIDFWIESQLTLSDGTKFKFKVEEDKRLKKLSTKLNRKANTIKKKTWLKKLRREDRGTRFYKLKEKITLQHERIANKRKTIKRKVVSYIKNNFSLIVMQDEQIANWHKSWMKWWWKRIQNSAIGGIIGDLKKIPTTILLNKFISTSRPCSQCWCLKYKEELWLDDRIYDCLECWVKLDRDVNSALFMETLGTWIKIPLEQRKFTLLEIKTSNILSHESLLSLICKKRNHLL